jgi:hypothetical protein
VAALGTVLQGGGRVLRAFGVVAVPQQYLALAITNPSALPVKAAPGSPVRFKFSVSSTHEAAVRQQWVVDVAEPPAAAQVIARGAVTVARGSTVRVPVDFAMPATRGGVVITISAPGQNRAPLQFRVATAPAAGAQ